MKLTIRLPGVSLASDLALARGAAESAVRHAHGQAPMQTAPAGTSNPCEQNRCKFLEVVYDDLGNPWLLYDCEGTLEIYPA